MRQLSSCQKFGRRIRRRCRQNNSRFQEKEREKKSNRSLTKTWHAPNRSEYKKALSYDSKIDSNVYVIAINTIHYKLRYTEYPI